MAVSDNTTLPTEAQRQRAAWDLLLTDIELKRTQSRWESPRALALVLIAVTVLGLAVGAVIGWPRPQVYTVRFDGPLTVKLVQ
jgi:hypothetical protein